MLDSCCFLFWGEGPTTITSNIMTANSQNTFAESVLNECCNIWLIDSTLRGTDDDDDDDVDTFGYVCVCV